MFLPVAEYVPYKSSRGCHLRPSMRLDRGSIGDISYLGACRGDAFQVLPDFLVQFVDTHLFKVAQTTGLYMDFHWLRDSLDVAII
jgi:hypothetical protein